MQCNILWFNRHVPQRNKLHNDCHKYILMSKWYNKIQIHIGTNTNTEWYKYKYILVQIQTQNGTNMCYVGEALFSREWLSLAAAQVSLSVNINEYKLTTGSNTIQNTIFSLLIMINKRSWSLYRHSFKRKSGKTFNPSVMANLYIKMFLCTIRSHH